jgi:hypothetical protein
VSGQGGSSLDRIARELASGEVSRRSALKRLAGLGLGLGAAMAPAGVAEALGGDCPPGRVKCDGKCCPKHARCRNGRCKCKPGFKKCGGKCVNLQTSVKHCGDCATVCPEGRACIAGQCAECSIDADCPDDPQNGCVVGVCSAGTCTLTPVTNGNACDDGSLCTANESCQNGQCTQGSPVVCTAQDQCHDAGTCNPQTGSCSNPEKPNGTACTGGTCQAGVCTCTSNADCGGNATICSEHVCADGVCVDVATDGEVCGASTTGCPVGQFRDRCCLNGSCSQNCSPCTT